MIVALCEPDGWLVKRMEVPDLRPEYLLPKEEHLTFAVDGPEVSAPRCISVRRFRYEGAQLLPEGIPIYVEAQDP